MPLPCIYCAQLQGQCARSCTNRIMLAAGVGCCNRMRVRRLPVVLGDGRHLRRVTCEIHGERLYDPAAYMAREEDWSGPDRWLDLPSTHPLRE